jgi:hypothetical protein
MRRLSTVVIAFCMCAQAVPQSQGTGNALVTKARSLYDAPFTRDLASFDCAVQFDWKQHFTEFAGTISPTAMPILQRLQSIQHRVSVDNTHAVVASTPQTPDFSGAEHAADLEQVFITMISSVLSLK